MGNGRRSGDHEVGALDARGLADRPELEIHEVGLVGHGAPRRRHGIGIQALPELVVRLPRMQPRLGGCIVAQQRRIAFNQCDARLPIEDFVVSAEGDFGVVDIQQEHR